MNTHAHDCSWNGKVVFITGAGSGIGRATALAFAQKGAQLVIAGRGEAALLETEKLIVSQGGQKPLLISGCDVGREADIAGAVKRIADTFGRLDVAFNNAGVEQVGTPMAGIGTEEWDTVQNANLRGVFLSMKHEIPLMLKTGGSIVNTSSVAGVIGIAGAAAYCAAKWGVIGLTKAAALDYAKQKIRINAVCPGPIETPMIERFGGGEEGVKRILEFQPVGRTGKAEEIAETVLHLCAPGAAFVTGTALVVDGGQTAGITF